MTKQNANESHENVHESLHCLHVTEKCACDERRMANMKKQQKSDVNNEI